MVKFIMSILFVFNIYLLNAQQIDSVNSYSFIVNNKANVLCDYKLIYSNDVITFQDVCKVQMKFYKFKDEYKIVTYIDSLSNEPYEIDSIYNDSICKYSAAFNSLIEYIKIEYFRLDDKYVIKLNYYKITKTNKRLLYKTSLKILDVDLNTIYKEILEDDNQTISKLFYFNDDYFIKMKDQKLINYIVKKDEIPVFNSIQSKGIYLKSMPAVTVFSYTVKSRDSSDLYVIKNYEDNNTYKIFENQFKSKSLKFRQEFPINENNLVKIPCPINHDFYYYLYY